MVEILLIIILLVISICLTIALIMNIRANRNRDNINAKIEDLAYKDFETNIYNTNYLVDNYKRIVKRIGLGKCVYITIDVDNFKFVNNVMGYEVGNKILYIIAEMMKENSKDQELVIRVGGDIFGMIMMESEESIIIERVEKIFEDVKRKVTENYTDRASINFSCGVCKIESFDETIKALDKKS